VSFLSGADLGKLIAAGILTPVLGLIGTKVKELLEARDVRQQSQRLMQEVTELLAFAETLQKASNSGTALENIPTESIATLQAAIAERIKTAVKHISPSYAQRVEERHLARDIFDRLFLLHRPLTWWAWPVHALYYCLLGMLGVVGAITTGDFHTHDAHRWDDITAGVFLIVLPLILLNLLANLIDRRRRSNKLAAPSLGDLPSLAK
jgi:hypothetical protein